MLKVFKYDWRKGFSSVKTTLLAALLLSAATGVLLHLFGASVQKTTGIYLIVNASHTHTIVMLISVAWFAVMVALLVQTIDAIVRNMTTRMFGPEGYLTHTLPVDIWELLLGKALGTWLFGTFMLFAAFVCLMIISVIAASSQLSLLDYVSSVIQLLPKLAPDHYLRLSQGIGMLIEGLTSFVIWSFIMMIQFQFICIAARQFGRFHLAGGIIVYLILVNLEGRISTVLSAGFLATLLAGAACFAGSWWLIKNKLALQ